MEPVKVPNWANFSVVVSAPDGRHVKFYTGFVRARMEFESQHGHNSKAYFAELICDRPDKEQILANWDLEKHVRTSGYLEVVDDWGRVIIIQSVKPGDLA
jgi:hypothetical protein